MICPGYRNAISASHSGSSMARRLPGARDEPSPPRTTLRRAARRPRPEDPRLEWQSLGGSGTLSVLKKGVQKTHAVCGALLGMKLNAHGPSGTNGGGKTIALVRRPCDHGARVGGATDETVREIGNGQRGCREEWPVSYTHLRAHETDSYLVCRLL